MTSPPPPGFCSCCDYGSCLAGTQKNRTEILVSQLHHFLIYGPVSMTSSHTWVLFSLGGRSRLHSGRHRKLHGNGNRTGRQDHSGQEGKAEGSWGAVGQRGRSMPHSWDHRNYCCHSGRACHTVVPTPLGHTLWNREWKGVTRHLAPLWVPHTHLQKRQVAAMDSDSHQRLTTGTVVTPPAWCTLAPVRSHTTTMDTLLGTEGWPEMG